MRYQVRLMHAKIVMSFIFVTLILFGCGEGTTEETMQNSTGSVTGTVTNTSDSSTIANATVKIGNDEKTTNANGVYNFDAISIGNKPVVTFKTNFDASTSQVNVKENIIVTHDVTLSPSIVVNKPVIEFVDSLEKNLIAYYPFNGNADDESGNGNNGIVNGASLTLDRNGFADNAYYFDGSNDYISLGQLSNFPSNEITISIWVNKNTYGEQFGFLGKWDNAPGTNNSFLFYNNQDSNVDYPFFALQMENDQTVYGVKSSKILDIEEWVNLIAVRNLAGVCNLFFNSELVGTNTDCGKGKSISKEIFSYNAVIGNWGTLKRAHYFNGKLDDIRIYNRALEKIEVNDIFVGLKTERRSNNKIVLCVNASDAEDGLLNADSITWESDIDGEIGVGECVTITLSAGEHIISVTGVDNDGNITIVTNNLFIEKE